jgi:hypothetical protein
MSLVPLKPSVFAARGVKRTSATQSHNAAGPYPAPNGGLDYMQQLTSANPLTANTLENLIPRVYGCELRKGYMQWVGGLNAEVRSLLPYTGSTGDNVLFAATALGAIYDVTASSPTPTAPVFTHPSADVFGECYSINFAAGDKHYLLVVSAGVGYLIYDGTTWTNVAQGTDPGEINGPPSDEGLPVDPIEFSYIFQWKGRVWFLKRNSAIAYYLPIGQITGQVHAFDFGPLLPHGGPLEIGANWTVDAGDGIDDKLVLFSLEGDILMYAGTDLTDATKFAKEGSYYVGHLPLGRRCVARFNTDLAILTEKGLGFLSEVLRGEGFFKNAETAQRVNAALSKQVTDHMTQKYWELVFLPHEQMIVINTPTTSAVDMQWAYEVNAKAFCTLTRMPMLCVIASDRRTFFGDLQGNVWLGFEGSSDGAKNVGGVLTRGADVEGAVVSAFLPHGEPFRLKTFLLVRPTFLASSPPSIKVTINSDWTFNAPKGAPQFTPAAGSSLWDTGIWNQTVWNGSDKSFGAWVGVNGIGYFGALSMKVRGEPGTTFVSWQILTAQGGVL